MQQVVCHDSAHHPFVRLTVRIPIGTFVQDSSLMFFFMVISAFFWQVIPLSHVSFFHICLFSERGVVGRGRCHDVLGSTVLYGLLIYPSSGVSELESECLGRVSGFG